MKSIDDYIEAIKAESELHSIKEVEQIIGVNGQRHANLKIWKLVAVISILAVTSVFLFFTGNENIDAVDQNELAYSSYRYSHLLSELYANPNYKTSIITSNKLRTHQVPREMASLLSLPIKKLEQMGFKIKDDEVFYEVNIASIGYLNFWMTNDNTSLTISERMSAKVPVYDFYPLYVSDINGKQRLRYRLDKEDKDKMYSFHKRIDHLIPILVKVPNGNKKMVLWFLPTKNLLDILEEDVLKTNNYLADYKPFGEFEEVKIIPNPTARSMGLSIQDFSTPPKVELFDIQGNNIKELTLEDALIQSKTNQYRFNLNGIDHGMYLVSISGKDKEKIYKRLIVTEN